MHPNRFLLHKPSPQIPVSKLTALSQTQLSFKLGQNYARVINKKDGNGAEKRKDPASRLRQFNCVYYVMDRTFVNYAKVPSSLGANSSRMSSIPQSRQ